MKFCSLRLAVFDREKLSGEMQDEPKMGTYFKFYSSSSTYLTVKLNQIQLICFSVTFDSGFSACATLLFFMSSS